MSSAARAEAATYHRQGLCPIPTKRNSKEPNLTELAPYLSRRASKEELSSWSWPGVGIVTGPLSGILVLDVDGPEGEAELKRHGHQITPMVRTASGGLHLYFRHPDTEVRTGIRVAPGLDVKAAGGYVVAPPSVGPNGQPYEWLVSLEEAEPADPPGWLIRLLERPSRNGAGQVGERIPPGQRNKELTSLAGSMRRRGMDAAEILAALDVTNERRCEPPLGSDEVEKIAASVSRYDHVAGDVIPVSFNGNGRPQQPARFNLTDMGNAERFVARHGDDVRYCYPWGRFLVFTGQRSERDEAGRTHRLAKETVRSIYGEAAAAEDEDRRKALAKHATSSEAEGKIKGMLELAKSEVPISPEELDADPWLFNVPNGTIDLRMGELRPHRREDRITKMAGAEYHPDAPAPIWAATLERVLPSNEVRAFFKRLCGCALTGVVSEHILPLLHGTGANGKSTVLNALLQAFGDYGIQAAPDLLIAKRGAHPTELADLFRMRLVASVETEDGRRFAESLVKQLTGGDKVRARRMREDFWEFEPSHTVFLATNHRPEVRGTDNAIWRRIRLIPFTETIPPEEQDNELPEKLRGELPGILAWVVEGCLEWRRGGLQAPDEVLAATQQYREEMDVLGTFLDECCDLGPGKNVAAADLYAAYGQWCTDTGEQQETQRKFGRRLTERGVFTRYKGGANGAHRWKGLDLLTLWKSRISRDSDPTDKKVTINSSKNTPREKTRVSGSEGPEGPVSDLKPRDVLAEFARGGSGPEKTAKTYLAGETRLEYVVRAVLFAKGMDNGDWEQYAPAVEEALEEWGKRDA